MLDFITLNTDCHITVLHLTNTVYRNPTILATVLFYNTSNARSQEKSTSSSLVNKSSKQIM